MHIVSGLIRKAPFVKDDPNYKMYVVELSEMIKDYKTQEKTYSNYKAMFFAKTDGARNFYDQVFKENSFVVVSAEKLKVDTFAADNGTIYTTLMLDNPRLENAKYEQDQGNGGNWGQPQQPQSQPQQQQYQQPQQQQQQRPQQQYNEPPMDYSDDIPFAPIGLMYNNNLMHCIS